MIGAKDILVKVLGDNSGFKKAMSGADKSMGGFSSSLKKHAAGAALAFAGMATAFAAMATKMAAAEEVVNRQTESMLESQGIMWSTVKDELADYINELERLTAYGDTDLQMAFNRMSSSGMSYNATLESMKMVTDIAYTRNMDLVAAADLVSKAYNGQGSSLKRYGIIIESGVTGLEALAAVQEEVNNSFADAEDRTDTLNGKLESLKNNTDDAAEAFGAQMLPVLDGMGNSFYEMAGGAEAFGESLGKIATLGPRLVSETSTHFKEMKKVSDLRKIGIDTEDEMINLLRLEGEELIKMSDAEFKGKQSLLEKAGYEERSHKIEQARLYGLSQKLRVLNEEKIIQEELLNLETAKTTEIKEQINLSERKAAADRAQVSGNRFGSSASSLRETMSAYEAGTAYTRTSGEHTIHGNKSGL